jgi:hypothetical protein
MPDMIAFGPFLTRGPGRSLARPNIESTGCLLEFSSASQGARIPIYRRRDEGARDFSDYLFHERDAPFPMRYSPYNAVQTELGLFVGLESLIVALYQERQVARPLERFLSEFRDCLPLEKAAIFSDAKPKAGFKPGLTELGFYLLDMFSYGRRLTASVGWYCPQDRANLEHAPFFSAGALEFRPRPDGTLDAGKWLEPAPGHLISLLRDLMRKASPGAPLGLLSEEGKRMILDAFKWTPLARMTNKDARQARVEFAKKHPELLENPKQLAQAMRQAQLYAETTSLRNILGHLDSIIHAARR